MSYDYVIVGAGSAGCVLAARLSEDPATTVLLLEAGPPGRKLEIGIPAAFGKLFGSEVDWGYATVPAGEVAGRSVYWPRGRTLGGSPSINAQVYVRGDRTDFDGWAAADTARRAARTRSRWPACRANANPACPPLCACHPYGSRTTAAATAQPRSPG